MVQWLRLQASTAGGMGLIPRGGTRIPHALRHGQKKKIRLYEMLRCNIVHFEWGKCKIVFLFYLGGSLRNVFFKKIKTKTGPKQKSAVGTSGKSFAFLTKGNRSGG